MSGLRSLLCKLFKRIVNNDKRGYIALLVCVSIPVVLLSVKYVIDNISLHKSKIHSKSGDAIYKRCAKEAALEVAKNWNPALTYNQQKSAVLKVADGVYNTHPAYHDSVIGNSIPGIDRKDGIAAEQSGGIYDPLTLKTTTTTSMGSDSKVVEYIESTKYYILRKVYPSSKLEWNLSYAAWRIVDTLTSSNSTSLSKFDELDTNELANNNFVLNHAEKYGYCHQWRIRTVDNYPTRTDYLPWESRAVDVVSSLYSTSQSDFSESGFTQNISTIIKYTGSCTVANEGVLSTSTYKRRRNENDTSVQVSVDGDRIKVLTDSDIGYAIPAECNVDIVLSCPVNAAASNINNNDVNTLSAEYPYQAAAAVNQVNNDIQSTPVYQIGQAFREFLKSNFYHTRGVNVGLIPYSGKISISPDVAEAYTGTASGNYQNNNNSYFYTTNFIQTSSLTEGNGQNAYPHYLRGVHLYDSYGQIGDLNQSFQWNTPLTGCPIRYRRGGCVLDPQAGNNCCCYGDLLSNAKPQNNATYFQRQNANPCYIGYGNLLSMKCDKNCTTYLPNPYYIIELTSDVQKVYELCGALYPVGDKNNISNFVFLPITWANNLFQSWSNDPKKSAENTSGSSTGGQLSHPSKSTSGRKKALILLVNKPDYFEHQELTYLGFNNDFSEVPLIESDCIRFDVNYSDTSRKFADGSSYNGTIQGAKKILKYETTSGTVTRNSSNGYYESSETASGKLSFHQKYLLKIVVEPARLKWENQGDGLAKAKSSSWCAHSQIPYNGKVWVTQNSVTDVATSEDGINWTLRQSIPGNAARGISYGNGIFMATGSKVWTSSDGITWTSVASTLPSTAYDSTYGNNKFFAIVDNGSVFQSKNNGVTWETLTSITRNSAIGNWWCIVYGNGKLLALSSNGYVSYSEDDAQTWSSPVQISRGWLGLAYINGEYFIGDGLGNYKMYKSSDCVNWSDLGSYPIGSDFRGIGYIGDKIITHTTSGTIFIGEYNSKLKFTNINPSSNGTTSEEYKITGKREFYIEPSQLTTTNLQFNMTNIRLISAEITNRPYKKIIPTCSLSGTTSGTGTAYITTNVKRKMTIKSKALPLEGAITFYSDNGIEDCRLDSTSGTPVTLGTVFKFSGTKKFVFSGSKGPNSNWLYYSARDGNYNSSGGINFGHNLSPWKVRYQLQSGAKIKNCVLKQQVLRDYLGVYGLNNTSIKTLILRNGAIGIRSGSSYQCQYLRTIEINAY